MPIKNNGYSHIKADQRRDKKRQEAEARQRAYDALPLATKLAQMGKKQRARWDKQQAELAKKGKQAIVKSENVITIPDVVPPATAPKAKKAKKQKAAKVVKS